MIKLLLLIAIAFMSCNGPNDPPGDEDKSEKAKVDTVAEDQNLYSTIIQKEYINYYPEGYNVVTRIWVGKKHHDGPSMSIEYDEVTECSRELLESVKKIEYNKALKAKTKIDSVLYIKNSLR